LSRIDDAVCDRVQDGYCYLLDRFGVRIGDIVCVLTIAQTLSPRQMAGYAAALVCLALGSWVSAHQRALRPLRVGLVAFAAYGVISGAHPLSDKVINVALACLLTCKVRKRDEYRFRKRRLATSHA
jgi:hypothetical protein